MTRISLQKDIISLLLYGEIFQYPMTLEELSLVHDRSDVKSAIDELVTSDLVHQCDGYYYVFDASNKINARIRSNENARKAMPKAIKIGQFIQRFPFVEGVGISGSLSKGVLDQDGDFDYFIITRPNRLWIARTLLILYKKIFLFNSRKNFCLNYFIDSDHLEIEERNLFTATEIATLIPVCGNAMSDFQQANVWIESHGKKFSKSQPAFESVRKTWVSRVMERLFNGRFGERIDVWCMRRTLSRWEHKFPKFQPEKFDLAMKTRRYVSKHHPNDFQNRVLNRYAELQQQYNNEYRNELFVPDTSRT